HEIKDFGSLAASEREATRAEAKPPFIFFLIFLDAFALTTFLSHYIPFHFYYIMRDSYTRQPMHPPAGRHAGAYTGGMAEK
ncbi:hypothetical protein, partial [Cloacibacillus porcorum]|uniref:hypothetical protein n=1 Tax=Cloacibacillus porcorum TaxID=1197717 RepID=UPI00248F0DC8